MQVLLCCTHANTTRLFGEPPSALLPDLILPPLPCSAYELPQPCESWQYPLDCDGAGYTSVPVGQEMRFEPKCD